MNDFQTPPAVLPFTYDAIAPLVARREARQGELLVTFRCPLTGVEADGAALLPPSEPTLWQPPRSLPFRILHRARRLVRGLLGRQRPAPPPATGGWREATVAAFNQVSEAFRWDTETQRWTGRAERPTYQDRLRETPVQSQRDRALLERMLVEIASVSSTPSAREDAFLVELLGDGVWPPKDRAGTTRLTPAELESASPGSVRESMLLLTWAVALYDGLTDAELQRMAYFADGLGIPDPQLRALRDRAADALAARPASGSGGLVGTVQDVLAKVGVGA